MCPNINLEEVTQQFNEIVQAFGGTPLTLGEFQSKEERGLRTGVDATAMDAAYAMWDLNNGYAIDQTPDGKQSELFDWLMSLNGGDRAAAIKSKSLIYSKKWLSNHPGELTEPSISEYRANFTVDSEDKGVYIPVTESHPKSVEIFGENRVMQFMDNAESQQEMRSQEVMRNLVNYLPVSLRPLFNAFAKANIKVEPMKDMIEWMAYDPVNQVIRINTSYVEHMSMELNAYAFLHEMVHHYLAESYNNPQTADEIAMKEQIDYLYSFYKKHVYKGDDRLKQYAGFALENENEFIAYLLSDESFKTILGSQPLSPLFRVKNALKRLINAFSRVLINKEIFSSLKEQIDNLFRTAMLVVQSNNKYGIRAYTVPQNMSEAELLNVDSFLMAIKKQQKRQFTTDVERIQAMDELDKTYNSLKAGLEFRMAALGKRNNAKRRLINELKGVLRDITNSDSMMAVLSFIDHTNSLVGDAKVALLRTTMDSLSTQDLMNYKTDFEGFYLPMMEDITSIVLNTEHFKNFAYDRRNTLGFGEYEELVYTVTNIEALMKSISSRYNHAIKKRTVLILKEMSKKTGAPTQVVNNIISNLEITDQDLSKIGAYAGMATNVKSNLIGLVTNALSNSINKTLRNTLREGNKLKRMWLDARKKYGNDAMKYFREVDSTGKPTGYMVRAINYGQQKAEFQAETLRLAEKYKLAKDYYGNYVLPVGETQEELDLIYNYNKDLNKWLADHVERKYVPQYYDNMNRMTENAKEALTEIAFAIEKILDGVIDEEGVPQLHKLSYNEYFSLLALQRDKRALSVIYDSDGNEKGGIELLIALNINEVNSAIRDNVTYKASKDRFEEKRKQMEKDLTPEEYKLWYKRNTREALPEDLQELLNSMLNNVELSDEYEDLRAKRRALLSLVRESDSSRIAALSVSPKMKAAIKEVDEAMARERYTDPEGAGREFFQYFSVEVTRLYKEQMEMYKADGAEAYSKWFEENHYEDANGFSHPISIWTHILPRNEQGNPDPSLFVRVPNQLWSEIDPASPWYNSNFDNKLGETYQPKKSKYNNAQQWNELNSKPELKALYNELLATMSKSLDKITFMANPDIYKLPQVSARTMLILMQRGSVFKNLGWVFKNTVEVRDEDVDYIPEFLKMPNQEYLKHIPTRYLSMLEDTSYITTDTVASVISFFEMAENYQNMSEIKDDINTIMNTLQHKKFDSGKEQRVGKELNEYKKLDHLLDTNLYGKKKDKSSVTVKLLGGKRMTIDIGKIAYAFSGFVRNRNLVYNIWSTITNYITASTGNKVEALAGRYFDTTAYGKAVAEYVRQLPNLVSGLGDAGQVSRLIAFCEYNGVTRSTTDAFDRLDSSRTMRFLSAHHAYGGYSAGDFAVKSKILLSLYFDNKLITMPDGTKRYMNRQMFLKELYKDDPKLGKQIWSTNTNHLYNAYVVDKNNNLQIRPELQPYVTEELENRIRNTANFVAAKTDGMLSDLDRSKLHTNAYFQFLTLHRGFMINGIHDRFKSKHYNYATGLYERGLYPSAAMGVGKLFLNVSENTRTFSLSLRQIASNWHNLEDYERYAVKKTAFEIGNIVLWMSVLVPVIASKADEDKDNWFLNAAAYIAMRTAFELRALYNPMEFLALLKSPSAAVNVFDDITQLAKLVQPSSWEDVRSGPYVGMKRGTRTLIKATPFKNIVEMGSPREKRKYLENQIMW